MAAITIIPGKVSPLPGSTIMRIAAAAAITNAAGKAVYVDGNAQAAEADASAVGTSHARGIVAGIGNRGIVNANANQNMDVVTHGPVYIGEDANMTPGAIIYNSATAGALDETAPTTGEFPSVVGYALTASIVYVDPQAALPVVVS